MRDRKFHLDNWNDKLVVIVSVIALFLFSLLLYIFYSFVGTFILALFMYYATRPLYRIINKKSPSKTLSAATSIVIFVVPIIFLISYTIIIASRELNSAVPMIDLTNFQSFDQLIELSNNFVGPDTDITEEIVNASHMLVGTLPDYISLAVTASIHALLVICITFYLLRDDHLMASWFKQTSPKNLTDYMISVDKSLHSVFFGNILNAGITALIAAVTFNLINLISPSGLSIPYPMLISILCGIGSLVPIIGIKIVYIPIASYLMGLTLFTPLEGLWFVILFFVISTILVDGIPDILLRPYVSSEYVHTGMLMVAYIIGPLIFGWYGLFLGPFFLVLISQFVDDLLPFLIESQQVQEDAQPSKQIGEIPESETEETESETPESEND